MLYFFAWPLFHVLHFHFRYATDSAGGNKDSICDLIRDASGSTVVCFNEFNEGMSLPPRVLSSGRIETEREHRDRLLVFAARYLSERLGLTIKLLLAHDNDSLGTAPGAGGLPVFTIQELLRQSISEASSEETGVLQTALGDCGDIWARVSVDNDLQVLQLFHYILDFLAYFIF